MFYSVTTVVQHFDFIIIIIIVVVAIVIIPQLKLLYAIYNKIVWRGMWAEPVDYSENLL